jgi:hypothetical protein
MSVKIYRHSGAHAIFIEDANGVQFLNSLQASVDNGTCSITDLAKNIELVSDTPYGDFVDENDAVYGNTSVEVCDALNAMFQNSGTPTASLPDITSPLTISLVQGETLNYELIATNGVAYEWDFSNVSSVANVEGNTRKIIGGAGLAVGTYNIPVKAINYNGEDSETIVLTVSTPSFANTKSVKFESLDFLSATASLLDGTLGRVGNGAGSGDAWTISFWVKPTSATSGRVLFYYGSSDVTNGGFVEVRLTSANKMRLQYGSDNSHIKILAPNALTADAWQHIVMTYDGGTTGASSADISDYYSRFEIYIDGVAQTPNTSHLNYGWSGAISGQNLHVGKLVSGNTLSGEKIDELAIWNSDETANVSSIYNSGTPFDLSTLTNDPLHWWRMGDGDTYPTLQDSGSAANCDFTMSNMTAANIVSDIPT